MKNIFKIQGYSVAMLVVAAVSLLSACRKDFLDREPQGSYTQETYPYPQGSGPYDTYLFGGYSELRSFNVHSQAFIAATSIRSDDADKGSTPADGGSDAINMDNFPVSPGSGYNNTLWLGYFSLINKCNIALDQIRNNAAIVATTQQKMQAEGEARFLRGYGYFMLVRLFGRVPIIDTVKTISQFNVPQSTPEQTYAFIEADLTFAAANLPPTWDSKFVGRSTSGAANGLLAKVYLTQQKWAQAMAAAGAVINSGIYNLNVTYDNEFRETGENGPASVFEVQATASFNIPQNNGVQYVGIQGVRGSGIWNLGWGWNTPSLNLDTSYEAGDPRRIRTILYTSPGSTSIYGEALPSGLPNPRYNQKAHTNPALRIAYNNNFGYWYNIRILRYSDVLLMYAEAANEVGGAANTTEALAKLEIVRARARNGNNAILPPVTTTDQGLLREAIHRERRFELAMEHDRFFDIVRWGTSQAVLNGVGKTNYSEARDKWLPIPLTQIDLSQNVLTQNFGY
jgi:starch-binding outer membrane protein, SusD/RagB family